MRKNPMLWIGSILCFLLLFVVIAGPYLPFVDLTPVKHRWGDNQKLILPPYKYTPENPLGSDKKGVDNLSRLIVGARITLGLAGAIALVRYVVGVPLGLLARKRRGLAHFILALQNNIFSYIPPILAATLFISLPLVLHSPLRIEWIILFLAIVEVGRVGYFVQQHAYSTSKEPFVEAGNALGLSSRRLFRKYYMPALYPELIVNFCIDLGKSIILLGQLGVLEVFIFQRFIDNGMFKGYVNDGNDWGSLLAIHTPEIFVSKFQYVLLPAFAMFIAIVSLNILGEGLRRRYSTKFSSK